MATKKPLTQQDIHELRHLVDQARQRYIENWRLATEGDVPVERLARSIAGLLLDDGFSTSGLHRWLTGVESRSSPPGTVSELLDAVDHRLGLPPRTWRVIVPIEKLSLGDHPDPPELHVEEAARELMPPDKPIGERGFGRVAAALSYEIEAKDDSAAAAMAAERIARLGSRVAMGLPSATRLRPAGSVWVERADFPGDGRWLPPA